MNQSFTVIFIFSFLSLLVFRLESQDFIKYSSIMFALPLIFVFLQIQKSENKSFTLTSFLTETRTNLLDLELSEEKNA